MKLEEFLQTQRGVSSFGLYVSGRKDNIIETQLSLATALKYRKADIDYVNYCICEDINDRQIIRACIYVLGLREAE